jgi:hypothetical protein
LGIPHAFPWLKPSEDPPLSRAKKCDVPSLLSIVAPILKKMGMCQYISGKTPNTEYFENPFCGSRDVSGRQTEQIRRIFAIS